MDDTGTAVVEEVEAIPVADTAANDFDAAVEADEKAEASQATEVEKPDAAQKAESKPKAEPKTESKPKAQPAAVEKPEAKAESEDEPGPATKRLMELAGKKPDAVTEKAEAEPVAKVEDKAEPEQKTAETKEPTSGRKFKYVDPDTKAEIETTTDDWAQQFPDFAAFEEARLQERIERGEVVAGPKYDELKEFTLSLHNELFDEVLSDRWPNWREIGTDPKSEFRVWLAAQDKPTQAMLRSTRVRDAKGLLSAWEEQRERSKAKAEASRVAAEADKKRRDGLHGDTLAGGGARDAGTGDIADAFDSEAEKLDRQERKPRH